MSPTHATAAMNLNSRFMRAFPREAARALERVDLDHAAEILVDHSPTIVAGVWAYLTPDIEADLFTRVSEELRRHLLSSMDPSRAVALLLRLDENLREESLALVDSQVAKELRSLLRYSPGSAGALMNPRIAPPRQEATVAEALSKLREMRTRGRRDVFVIDDDSKLCGRVEIQDLAIAERDQPIRDLMHPITAAVSDTSPRDEVVEMLERSRLPEMPVVDFEGRLIGVIAQSAVISAIQEEASIDIQKMFGASGDERALSKVSFAVRKRLPWLEVNLATAFLASAVVGLFSDIIDQFTALAILLPVVAGQSGNAGAQSLAVTMRGLALREIGLRQSPRVVLKEASVGLLNGLAVALTTSIIVFLWSGSTGLAMVIASSMVIAMVAAGFSGAIIPIALRRMGLDPAQSSSIVLTTVTDVVGFFSFLGIATMLASQI